MILDYPAPQKPERGHIRQHRPLAKTPFFSVDFCGVLRNYRAICCKMGYRTGVPV